MEQVFKNDYKRVKNLAKNFSVKTCRRILEGDYGYNGLTIAYCPAFLGPECRMMEVSVSYCAPEDTFKKKTGKYHAVAKMLDDGEFVTLPLAEYYRDVPREQFEDTLLSMFTV